MPLGLTDDFTDLVAHVLAHVRLNEPGDLYEPRYGAWARELTPEPEARWLREGVEVLERTWARGAPPVVHAWPELFASIEAQGRVAAQPLASLSSHEVRERGVLRQAQAASGPALELLHATLCALGPWYARWRAEALVPRLRSRVDGVRAALDQAIDLVPALARTPVELSVPLGARGRVFAARIVVGAPADWNDLDDRTPVVLAMHEQLVRDSGHPDYAEAEWAALTGLAARLEDAAPPLVEAHRRWIASLDLGPVLAPLRAAGRIGAQERRALLQHVDRRAPALARLARR